MSSLSNAEHRSRWWDSGCAALTGRPDGPPLPPPDGLIDALDRIATSIETASEECGRKVTIDPLAELAVRATTHGLRRGGQSTCGGAGRLLRCAEGWLALSLARDADVELVPALVGDRVDEPWAAVAGWCRALPAATAEARGVLLGLPIAAVGFASAARPVTITAHATPCGPIGRRVLDLSSLWAGPLCGAILASAGCEVTKLESVTRPDGSHRGPNTFDNRLNGAKRAATFDPRTTDGRHRLLDAIEAADVVIEGSRPRALRQLGIDRDAVMRGSTVWVSITGHGRQGEAGDRVGFGDDAAAAGGLVVWDGDQPLFCADALADPITGMLAAAHVLEAFADGGGGRFIDLSMAGVAASCVVAQ